MIATREAGIIDAGYNMRTGVTDPGYNIRNRDHRSRLQRQTTGISDPGYRSPDDFHVVLFESRVGGENCEALDLCLRD